MHCLRLQPNLREFFLAKATRNTTKPLIEGFNILGGTLAHVSQSRGKIATALQEY